MLKKSAGTLAGVVAGDLEIDGRFGEGLVEKMGANEEGDDEGDAAGDKKADVGPVEVLFHRARYPGLSFECRVRM